MKSETHKLIQTKQKNKLILNLIGIKNINFI